MDTGPVLSQQRVGLTGEETGGGLMARLFEVGAPLLADTLEKYARGEISPRPQDNSQATVTSLLAREDGEIDWSQPAVRIARMVRAYDPWPGTHTRWRGQVLKVLEAYGLTGDAMGPPGSLSRADEDGGLVVAAGQGRLRLTRLQIEGKRALPAEEFLRGYPQILGVTLPC
jgi:methionyl-tRNA formyltransferase